MLCYLTAGMDGLDVTSAKGGNHHRLNGVDLGPLGPQLRARIKHPNGRRRTYDVKWESKPCDYECDHEGSYLVDRAYVEWDDELGYCRRLWLFHEPSGMRCGYLVELKVKT